MSIIKCECGKELQEATKTCHDCKRELKEKQANQLDEKSPPWIHINIICLFFGIILIGIGLSQPIGPAGSAGVMLGIILIIPVLLSVIILFYRMRKNILKLGYRRIGIILILVGIGAPSILFLFTISRYGEKSIVIIEHTDDYTNKTDSFNIAIQYKYVVVIGIISVLVGIGMIALPSKSNNSAVEHKNNRPESSIT